MYSYPKHVWSPAGGWYAQPGNWKANTAVMSGVILGIVAMAWSLSAEREYRDRMPEVRTGLEVEEQGRLVMCAGAMLMMCASPDGSSHHDTGADRYESMSGRRRRRRVSRHDMGGRFAFEGWAGCTYATITSNHQAMTLIRSLSSFYIRAKRYWAISESN